MITGNGVEPQDLTNLTGPDGFVLGDVYRQLPRAPETWLVESVLPIGGALNLYGQPKEGKSFAALQLAAAVANPSTSTWLGLPVIKHGKVCYLQVDTPRSLWAERLDSVTRAGLDLSRVWFADTLQTPYPFDILNVEHCKWLESQCLGIEPDLVIVDVIREVHQGDENDSGQMKMVINNLVAAIRPSALCLVSHSKKPSYNDAGKRVGSLMGDNRGSGYVAGKMDCIARVSPKRLTFKGRAVEETIIKMQQGDAGLWVVDASETDRLVAEVLADESLKGTRAKARALAELTGKSEEACRTQLRRAA